jgi:hypothetical protein
MISPYYAYDVIFFLNKEKLIQIFNMFKIQFLNITILVMESITDEDINILMAQGNISKNEARELLSLNDGNLVDSIITIQSENFDLEKLRQMKNEYVEEETEDFLVDTSKQKNLTKYREIVDSKDVIYNRKKQEKEEREKRVKEGKEEEVTKFSVEELYKLKRGNNTFNSIRVL